MRTTMTKYAIIAFVITLSCGLLSAQPCCERAVLDELYLPEDNFTPTTAAIDTPDTNPNPCDSCRILIDMSDVELHGNHMDSLFAFLNRSFCEVVIDSTGISPEGYDVFCFPFKDDSISTTRIREIQDYVYNGSTLILLGECCGFSWTLNELLTDPMWNTGLFINTDGILDSSNFLLSGGHAEFPIFKNHLYHPFTFSIDSIFLGRGGSSEILTPARRLTWGDDDAFSVIYDPWPPGTTIVVASEPVVFSISHFGEGIILLNSDISIWTSVVWFPGSFLLFSNKQAAYNFFNCNITPYFSFSPQKFKDVICFPETLNIEISIENYGMIEPDSVRVKWETTVLTTASPYIDVSDSTLSLSLPLDSYLPGDTVNLCIEAVCDTGGYWPFDSICWWYYLDPLIDSLGPIIERITTDSLYPADTLLAYVYDTSGIDTASILVLMNLDTVETFTFEAGTLSIWGFPDTTASVSVIIIVEDLYPCWDNMGSASFSVDIRTGIEETPIPRDFEIRAYPNPFNSTVAISISGVCDTPLRIEIYDVAGRLIQVIARPKATAISSNNRSSVRLRPSGTLDTRRDAVSINNREFIWRPAPSLGSGVYLVRAIVGDESVSRKIVYLK